jgi:hypothetical protein
MDQFLIQPSPELSRTSILVMAVQAMGLVTVQMMDRTTTLATTETAMLQLEATVTTITDHDKRSRFLPKTATQEPFSFSGQDAQAILPLGKTAKTTPWKACLEMPSSLTPLVEILMTKIQSLGE